ncbi:amine oxidase [Cordyceps militaris CM01]|uniref:Amine oxidase n=1 Tax=Cordyceps militaris (strain CM01) TaxID=983644 RepID=G3JFQ6_CORMM|nr:amine oxidase [Cordyceps militaris CM01]EGX92289.1 amine oxidase [Cordyceps militaris CM01]
MASKSRAHVAIIGAGLSGLRCADVLLQNGFQVSIFEGRDRIGGRVHQTQLGNGFWVDMGPNWIHGTTGNVILDLALQTGTGIDDIDDVSCAFDEAGHKLDAAESVKYETIMWEMIEEAFAYSATSEAEIDPKKSLMDFFKQKVPLKIPDGEPNAEAKRKTIYHLCETWGSFIGSPVTRQSLRFFWLEECIDDENLFCAGTYRKVLQHVAGAALNKANISLQTIVKSINYNKDTTGNVTVRLQDDTSYEFDEVVMTAPLGWLQKNKTEAFDPPLPASLATAIEAISYGCLEKVYISFPEAFWRAKDGQPEVAKGFIQWMSPSYHPERNASRWPQVAVELSSLGPEDAHPTLLFYTYGEQSQQLTSELAKRSDKKEKMDLIVEYFRPYYSRLPNYTADAPSCQPSDCLATEWLNDDLAGNGSYGNFQVGLEQGDEHIRTMREGLPDQGLWFAGEHTAPYVALGTSTGAYLSGEAVGERILEKYEQ